MPSPNELYSHHATVLPVRDVVRARDHYRDVLGFVVDFEWGEPLSYAILRAGESVQLHLSQVDAPAGDDPPRTMVYLFVQDVDRLHDAVSERGARVTAPLETMEYGMREFEVTDPDGHRLTFGQGV